MVKEGICILANVADVDNGFRCKLLKTKEFRLSLRIFRFLGENIVGGTDNIKLGLIMVSLATPEFRDQIKTNIEFVSLYI